MHADPHAKRIVELTAMAEKSERDAKCFRTQIDGLLLQVKGADMHAEGLRREIAELVSSMQEETKLFQQPKANSMQHQHMPKASTQHQHQQQPRQDEANVKASTQHQQQPKAEAKLFKPPKASTQHQPKTEVKAPVNSLASNVAPKVEAKTSTRHQQQLNAVTKHQPKAEVKALANSPASATGRGRCKSKPAASAVASKAKPLQQPESKASSSSGPKMSIACSQVRVLSVAKGRRAQYGQARLIQAEPENLANEESGSHPKKMRLMRAVQSNDTSDVDDIASPRPCQNAHCKRAATFNQKVDYKGWCCEDCLTFDKDKKLIERLYETTGEVKSTFPSDKYRRKLNYNVVEHSPYCICNNFQRVMRRFHGLDSDSETEEYT